MDLEALLRERYGLVDAEVEPHDGGMNSRTWWVRAGSSSYVAKWVSDDTVAGSLAAGVAAAALASSSGVPTGGAVEAVGGDRVLLVDGGSLVLLEVVPGDELVGESDVEAGLIGTTLARVHRATVGHESTLGLVWHWVDPTAEHLAPHPDLRSAVARSVAEIDALEDLVTGIGHGDPAPEAFLLGPTGEVGLIDWASAVSGPLLYDVASAAMYLGGLGDAAPMVAAYVAADGPAVPDLPHLAAMLRFRWAVQADYFAARIAAADLTGADDADLAKGLADARRHLLG